MKLENPQLIQKNISAFIKNFWKTKSSPATGIFEIKPDLKVVATWQFEYLVDVDEEPYEYIELTVTDKFSSDSVLKYIVDESFISINKRDADINAKLIVQAIQNQKE